MIALLLLIVGAFAAVDVNSADATSLETLPGIGPGKASAIVAYRSRHGPFTSLSDLDNVEGIGPSTLVNLKDLVSFGAKSTVSNPEAALAPTVPPAASAATATACSVNINTGDAPALEALPGIGPGKATAIVQYRADHGPFASCDALDEVSGIGPATLAVLRPCCVTK